MRLIFLGSGEFGLPTLEALAADAAHDVVAVVSQPDRPAGRKRHLTPTPIAAWAEAQDLPVLKTDNVNTPEFIAQVESFEADASIVIAFGQKLGDPFIAALGKLAVNLHASLLPAYRGAARSTGPSSTTTRPPACRSSRSHSAWMPATSTPPPTCPSTRRRPPASCTTRWRSSAPTRSAGCCLTSNGAH